MQGYFIQFLAYSMAMVGFLTLCIWVYKKFCAKAISHTDPNFLSIENGLRINARKQIYVVKAGNERFLIASDAENTTMLAKLEDEVIQKEEIILKKPAIKKHLGNIQPITTFGNEETPIMKRISEKMKA